MQCARFVVDAAEARHRVHAHQPGQGCGCRSAFRGRPGARAACLAVCVAGWDIAYVAALGVDIWDLAARDAVMSSRMRPASVRAAVNDMLDSVMHAHLASLADGAFAAPTSRARRALAFVHAPPRERMRVLMAMLEGGACVPHVAADAAALCGFVARLSAARRQQCLHGDSSSQAILHA